MSKKQRASKTRRRIYANRKQKQFLRGKQRRKTFVGGRGSGKSAAIGMENFVRAQEMPRAKSFLAAMTYDQLLTKTLPSVLEAWAMLGLKEYDPRLKMGHYVIGKRPPAAWDKPYLKPQKYDNVITLINGYTIELLSINGIENRRGGSYDAGDIDESALVKKEVITRILGPSLRGNPFSFENCSRHWALCDYTSAPWTPEGQWVFETEELAKSDPKNFLFVEATVYDNVVIWGGPERLEAIRKSTPKLEWEVEYMNVRLSKMPNSFYPAFSFGKHAIPVDWSSWVRDERSGLFVGTSDFIDPQRPLETSWDFNAAFTSLIVCQEAGDEFRIGNELYVKDGDSPLNKIDALTDKFLDAYKDHRQKVVFLHGDRNGNNKTANSDRTFYEQIKERMEKAGWEVYLMVSGLDPDHQLKHKYINAILMEDNARLPRIRFHQTMCKYTIVSIQNSPMSPDWKKDKRSERTLLEQERATHLSDCFDNIVYRKYAGRFDVAPDYQVYFLGR